MKIRLYGLLAVFCIAASCACSKYPGMIEDLKRQQEDLQNQYDSIEIVDSVETAPSLCIQFETDGICLDPGVSVHVPYQIFNGGEKPFLKAFSIEGWKTELVEETPTSGYLIVTAPSTPCDGSATILVSDGIRQTKLATLTFMAADFLTVTDNSLFIPAAGGTRLISLRSNIEYTLSCDAGWLKPINTKAIREEELKFEASQNTDCAPRKCSIILSDGTISTEITVFQSGRAPERDDKVLPIMGWYSIPANYLSVERFAEMEDCGFNISFSHISDHETVKKSLDLAAQTGVRLQVAWDGLQDNPEQCAAEIKDHPALWGYHIVDEPAPGAFDNLAQTTSRLKKADPNHPSYINLLPDYAGSAVLGGTFANYVHTYMQTVQPPLLSFDYYSIRTSGIVGSWWNNLRICYEEARAAGVEMWAFVLSTAHDPYPVSTPEMLRLYAYTDLVFGAQGIQYFTYWCPGQETWNFHEAPITEDGRRTATYDLVKAMNQELQKRAFVFLGADFKWMRSIGGSISGITPLSSADYPSAISSISADRRMAASHFTNEGHEYIAMVNCDYQQNRSVEMTFTKEVETIDKDGVARMLPEGSNTFVVGKGDILILRLK